MIYDEAALRDIMYDIGRDSIEQEIRLQERLCNMVMLDGQHIYNMEVYAMNKITLRVDGMTCGHCEIAVQGAVRELPGIKKAKANKRKKEVVVEYDTVLVTQEQIVEAINASGYSILS